MEHETVVHDERLASGVERLSPRRGRLPKRRSRGCDRGPAYILAALNEAMLRQRRENDDYKFCIIAYARLEKSGEGVEGGARKLVSCRGHSAPVLLTYDGGISKIDGCAGRALGVFDDANLTDQEARLEPGGTSLLYTDGVTGARAPDGTFFGEARLTSLLCSSVDLDAPALAGRIGSAVLDF